MKSGNSKKRATGGPYLTSSTSNRKHTLSRSSSSSILKKSSVETGSNTTSSGSSTIAMILPDLKQIKAQTHSILKKSKGNKNSSNSSPCHVEIIRDNDYYTNTEKYMSVKTRRRKSDEEEVELPSDANHNPMESPTSSYDDAVMSQEIALAVALIVAEYELMKQKQKKKQSHIHNGKQRIGETAVNALIPTASTISSALSQLELDPPDAVKTTGIFLLNTNTSTSTSTNTSGQPKSSKIRSSNSVGKTPPTPSRGVKMGGSVEVIRYLTRVQNFMNSLGYHREGEPEIKINVRLSMKMQMVTAKDLIRCALPIKCLHAVVLATYLTNCIDTLERFPIYFRSHVNGKEYKHIVLGIYVQGHFGALGISRDQGLQDKSTTYSKLSDLVFEFCRCYDQSGHTLNEVKFGQIITHDQNSLERVFSKIGIIPILGCSHAEIEANVERFSKQLRGKMGLACLRSQHQSTSTSTGALARISRSRTSMHNSNSQSSSTSSRIRAMSMGPISMSSSLSRRNSDERLGRSVIRPKPPKSIRNK